MTRGPRSGTTYAIGLGLAASVWALPSDPSPAHGQVQIQTIQPNFMQILQTSPQAILNWNQFNIGLGETVRFLQPSTQAAILNRVTGTDPSLIQGMLQANGRVFLLNPNGILFGPQSIVDVGSFTASTLKMSDDDFLSGSFRLTQDRTLPLAALTNQGEIRVSEGGYVTLVSPLLDNQGLIVAQSGQVHLGATTQATFSVDGRGLVQFAMPDGFNPQFTGGSQGGTVLLQPGQMSELLSQVIHNPNLVEAGSFEPGSQGQTYAHGAEGVLLNSGSIHTDGQGGVIRLDSSQASIHAASGLLSANSSGGSAGDVRLLSDGATASLGLVRATSQTGSGGFAEISGHSLWLLGNVDLSSAQGSAGVLLLDPDNITIIDGPNPTGSFDPLLPGGLPATGNGSVSTGAIALQTNLTLTANNDITYNGTGFTAATNLVLVAGNNLDFTTSGPIVLDSMTFSAGNDLTIQGNGGGLDLTANTGAINLATTTGDIELLAPNGHLTLTAIGSSILLDAGQDAKLSASPTHTLFTIASASSITANRDVILRAQSISQSGSPHQLNIDANRNFRYDGYPGLNQIGVGGLNVSAGGNLTSAQESLLIATTNDLSLTAVGSLNVTTSGALNIRSSLGETRLSGGNVTLSSGVLQDLNVEGHTGLSLQSTNGDLEVTSGAIASLFVPAGPLSVQATGGDFLATSASDLQLRSADSIQVFGNNISLQTVSAFPLLLDATSTLIQATGDLSIQTVAIIAGTAGPVTLSGGNVTVASVGGLNIGSFPAFTVSALQDVLFSAPSGLSITTIGDQSLTAGGNLTVDASGGATFNSNGGKITWRGGGVNSTTGFAQSFLGGGGINITSTSATEDLFLGTTNAGDLILQADNPGATVNVTSNRDLTLAVTPNGNIFLRASSSSGALTLNATRDVLIDTPQGFTVRFRGETSRIESGRDLSLQGTNFEEEGATALTLVAGRDISLGNEPGGPFRLQLSSVNASAGRDIQAVGVGGLDITALANDLKFVAANNVSLSSGGAVALAAGGKLDLEAQNVTIRSNATGSSVLSGAAGVDIRATSGDVNLQSDGIVQEISSSGGATTISAGRDVLLNEPGNLTIGASGLATVNATRDVALSTGSGFGLTLTAADALLSAGRNVTYTGEQITAGGNLRIETGSGGDVSLNSLPGLSLSVVGGGLNLTASRNLLANSDQDLSFQATPGGDIRLAAGGNLTFQSVASTNVLAGGSAQVIGNQNVSSLAGGTSLWSGAASLAITAGNASANGDLSLGSSGSSLTVQGANANLDLTASRDIQLQSAADLTAGALLVGNLNAGRDINLTSGPSSILHLNGTQNHNAGRDIRFNTNNIDGFVGLDLLATNDISLVPLTAGTLLISGQAFQAHALRNLQASVSGGNLEINGGPIVLRGDNQIDFNVVGGQTILSAPSNVTLQGGIALDGSVLQINAQGVNILATANTLFAPGSVVTAVFEDINASSSNDLDLTNLSLNQIGGGNVQLQANRNLRVGTVSIAAAANASLSGGNVSVRSMQDLTSGNFTITTPGNLTEQVAATNPSSLAGLNITAGRIHSPANTADNVSFSIPNTLNPANLHVLVTGGNDTSIPSAANLRNFNGANVQPGSIDQQTGDIYVDGVLFYRGIAPPPPPPPPSPPPTPTPPPNPLPNPAPPGGGFVVTLPGVNGGTQSRVLGGEERSQILAQSNLALGNLGSFSRGLSRAETSQLSARQDALHQTWALDPFSPTLALVLPGGPPVVLPSQLAQLQILLRGGGEELEEVRAAYNTIVDQELREIWAVRYWRYLIQRFVIWEDRE